MDNIKKQIPIKNIFYMLCYAWNVLSITDDIKVGSDDFNDAYNLLARVFSFGIGKMIKYGFHRSYISKTESLSTLRGKINIQQSINKMTIVDQKLICDYDDFSTNDIFNQMLRYTIDSLIANIEVDKTTKQQLKKQRVFFDGIDSLPPTKSNRQKVTFNRNSIVYQLLINISIMIYDNTIVNEETGTNTFKDFYRQEQMHKVFELFILNFYASHLNNKIYKVHAPKINWDIDKRASISYSEYFDIVDDPGDRRTDIVVENNELELQMIFDAKYYQKTFVEAYQNSDEERVRTGHINQLRGYLLDSKYTGGKVGALLYPSVDIERKIEQAYPIADANIIVKTINLYDEWQNIEQDMLAFINKIERSYQKLIADQK